jgi:hypothetical protein
LGEGFHCQFDQNDMTLVAASLAFVNFANAAVGSSGAAVCRRMESVASHSSITLPGRVAVEAGDVPKPWTCIDAIAAFELQ